MSEAGPAGESRAVTAPAPPRSRTKASRSTNNSPQPLASDPPKRTNSLGTADCPCHTCKKNSLVCDGLRPYCRTCILRGVKCGGFELPLKWQIGASRGKMKGQQLSVEGLPSLPSRGDTDEPIVFEFVLESGKGEKTPTKQQKSKTKSKQLLATQAQSPTPLTYSVGPLHRVPHHVGELLSFYESQFARTTITYDVKVNPWQCSIPMVYSTLCLMHAVHALSRRHWAHCRNHSETEDLVVLELKERALREFSSALQSTTCEALIATTLALIGLEYADTGFSDWTIYLDGAYRILESTDGLNHAATSSTLRCQIAMLLWWDITAALLSMRGPVFPYRYLDKVLSWSAKNPGEWSYMSLNGCPDALLLAMYNLASSAPFADQMNAADVWKLELCVHRVNAESPFNTTVDIEEDEAANPSYMSPSLYPSVSIAKPTTTKTPLRNSNDRTPNYDINLVNCWRLSMVLYLRQVFYRSHRYTVDERSKRREERRILSTSIISLVSEMPTESNWQKQCLLPVVLAGFELQEDGHRNWAKKYCLRWKGLTGLWVFGTAGELLERIWERMDLAAAAETTTNATMVPSLTSTYLPQHQSQFQQWHQEERLESAWWGDIVAEDARTRSIEGSQNPYGYLFG